VALTQLQSDSIGRVDAQSFSYGCGEWLGMKSIEKDWNEGLGCD